MKIPGDEQPVLAIELLYKAHLIAVDQILVTTQMQCRCNSWHPCSQLTACCMVNKRLHESLLTITTVAAVAVPLATRWRSLEKLHGISPPTKLVWTWQKTSRLFKNNLAQRRGLYSVSSPVKLAIST